MNKNTLDTARSGSNGHISQEGAKKSQRDCEGDITSHVAGVVGVGGSIAAAEALLGLLHNNWPGAEPLLYVSANKSHAGKGTVVNFMRAIERSEVM